MLLDAQAENLELRQQLAERDAEIERLRAENRRLRGQRRVGVDAQALAIVLEPPMLFHEPTQDGLAFVAERGMPQIVRERDRLGQVLIELERTRNVPRDTGHFHSMGEASAEMVAGAVEEDLGFVFEAPKGSRVDDTITIPLILRAPFGRFFSVFASPRLGT